MTNVLVKVEDVKSSKHSWQTEHFFFVPNFPTSKKKGIVLPASAHPSIVNGQAFTWGVGQQPLAVEPGVKTLKVSVWCKELQRENIHMVLGDAKRGQVQFKAFLACLVFVKWIPSQVVLRFWRPSLCFRRDCLARNCGESLPALLWKWLD